MQTRKEVYARLRMNPRAKNLVIRYVTARTALLLGCKDQATENRMHAVITRILRDPDFILSEGVGFTDLSKRPYADPRRNPYLRLAEWHAIRAARIDDDDDE